MYFFFFSSTESQHEVLSALFMISVDQNGVGLLIRKVSAIVCCHHVISHCFEKGLYVLFSSVQNLRRIPAVILSGRYSMQGRVCGKLAVIFKVPIVCANLRLKVFFFHTKSDY